MAKRGAWRGRRIKGKASEIEFSTFFESQGWLLVKRGWPDFLCFKDGDVVCVEVKSSSTQPLSKHQIKICEILMVAGIRCYRWDPEVGLSQLELTLNTRIHKARRGRKEISDKMREQAAAKSHSALVALGISRGYKDPQAWADIISQSRFNRAKAKS